MADVKISALPTASTPLDGTEVLPIVQSATTKQVSIANVTANRAITAASLSLTTPLGTTNGGTGLGSFTSGYVPYASNSSALSFSSGLYSTGSNIGIGGTTSPANPLTVIAGGKSGFNISYNTTSAVRSGLFMWTTGSSSAGFGGGVEQTADNVYTARSTVASMLRFASGQSIFYGDSSLTSGNTYTPTIRMTLSAAGALDLTGVPTVCSATATPAGGSTSARLLFGTTSGFGIYYGSGAPTVSAAQGSIYLRSDGSSTSTRMYINTNGSTTWTNVTTAA